MSIDSRSSRLLAASLTRSAHQLSLSLSFFSPTLVFQVCVITCKWRPPSSQDRHAECVPAAEDQQSSNKKNKKKGLVVVIMADICKCCPSTAKFCLSMPCHTVSTAALLFLFYSLSAAFITNSCRYVCLLAWVCKSTGQIIKKVTPLTSSNVCLCWCSSTKNTK